MPGLAALGQTIQVVDRSGKVVSTSRHLLDVFKIGRSAYNSQKEKVVSRREQESKRPRPSRAYTFDDRESAPSEHSQRSRQRSRRHHHRHRSIEDTVTNDAAAGVPFYEAYPQFAPQPQRRHSDFQTQPQGSYSPHSTPLQQQYHSEVPPQPQWRDPFQGVAMVRRHTLRPTLNAEEIRNSEGIDLDLAYGDVPPDLLYPGSPSVASTPERNEAQLKGLVGKANYLLEEADCLRSGATATIAHLQKNPDAMAAIGLTLAEISNLVKRMSPTVLASLRRGSPAVFSLLSHPQFLVAVGVAAGVTIIAFGGYKIVKRIQARREMESMGDEALLPVEDVSRIESWRRGIADVEAASVGTSVEGEFITPLAAKMSRMQVAENRRSRELEKAHKEREKHSGKDLRRRATMKEDERTSNSRAARSVTSSRSARSHRSVRSSSEPRAAKTRTTTGTGHGGKAVRPGTARGKKVSMKKQDAKLSPLTKLLLL